MRLTRSADTGQRYCVCRQKPTVEILSLPHTLRPLWCDVAHVLKAFEASIVNPVERR